jgi:hypothetical protein
MKFFVPLVAPKDQESTYQGIAKYINVIPPADKKKRVAAIAWTRFGADRYSARVGERAPADFGGEEVLAIYETDLSSFAICTATHGCVRGIPIHVNFNDVTSTELFSG